jgi:hypothetical protein
MDLAPFASGAIAMGLAVCALFFLRFWRRANDWFFGVFALAFLLLAINQALSTLLGLPIEERSWLYLLRLAAFSIIILAIIAKNAKR